MRFLKSKSTNYPDHGHHGDPPPTRKIPMVEPGIEPGTSWLVVRSSDHQTTRTALQQDYVNEKFQWHHRESNPRPSGSLRSVSTNCAKSCPPVTACNKGKNVVCLISLNITQWRYNPFYIMKLGIRLFSRSACSNHGTQWVVAKVGTGTIWTVGGKEPCLASC
jgi:hypothetical protein